MFGGGHVVLPLLQAEVVPPGWVTNEEFLAGYGAAQAVPGPLFTFAAYLGAVMRPRPERLGSARLLALVAIFLPAFLLVVGALPFWDALRARPRVAGRRCAGSTPRSSACCSPRSTTRCGPARSTRPPTSRWPSPRSACWRLWGVPPWVVVALSAIGGQALALLR